MGITVGLFLIIACGVQFLFCNIPDLEEPEPNEPPSLTLTPKRHYATSTLPCSLQVNSVTNKESWQDVVLSGDNITIIDSSLLGPSRPVAGIRGARIFSSLSDGEGETGPPGKDPKPGKGEPGTSGGNPAPS